MKPKKALEQLEMTEAAWEMHAAETTFYGTTFAQYKAKVQLSRDARDTVANLEIQLAAAKNQRNNIDKENLALERNVAKAIAGNEKYGDDSDLYEGTGRVRKSERKSGLTRKKKGGNENK
ncbi:MAG: hypothetical protein WA584_03855 [Pyrinomonadaceae bacterium]